MTGTTEKTSRHVRFSIVDFVILVLLLAGLIGIGARYDIASRLFSDTVRIDAEITVLAEAISAEEAAVFTKDTVFYTDGAIFGTLTASTTEKTIQYLENASGTLIAQESPDRYDVSSIFTVEVIATDDGYLLNGNRYIAPGSRLVIQGKNVSVTVLVTALTVPQD